MKIPVAPKEGCAWITGASSGMGLAMAAEQAPEPTPARRAPSGLTTKSRSWATQ